jgi:hypothetical protein
MLSRKMRRGRIAVKLGRRRRSHPHRWRLRIRMRQRLELLRMSAFYGLYPRRLCALEGLLLAHVLLRRGLLLLHLPLGQRLHLLLVLLLGLLPGHRNGPAGRPTLGRKVLLLRGRLLFQPLRRLPLWARWR